MGINKKTQEHHLDEGHNHGQSRHNAQDAGQGSGHSGHEGHGDHEQMFQNRFWVCMALSIPVLLYSSSIQEWLGFNMPAFPGSQWIFPIFSVIIFLYGGLPFLRMAVDELREGQPGMMTLISLAISVAFVYSLTTLVVISGSSFFWELVTLIDVMLLGHWIEMRSVRRASRALDELAELMPDTAERILDDGATREVSIRELHVDDLVLVRPGAGIPADGKVEEGESDTNEAMLTGESKPVRKKPGDEVIAGTINVVYLVQDEQVVGAFALADVIRPESKQAVRRLHDMGMQVAIVGMALTMLPPSPAPM